MSKRLKQQENYIPNYESVFSDSSNNKKGTSVLKKLLKINAVPLIVSTLIYILQASPIWIIPLITADIIDIATQGFVEGSTNRLIIDAVLIFILVIQNVPTTVWRLNIVNNAVRRTGAGVRCAVISKLQSLSITYHKDMQTGKIQAKFLKDVDAVEMLLDQIFKVLVTCIISVVVTTSISIYKSGVVTLFFLLVIPINVLLTRIFRNKIRKTNKEHRVNFENLSSKMSNMIDMLPVTKSHGLEENEMLDFNENATKLLQASKNLDKVNANFGSWMYAVNTLLGASCLIFCTVLCLNSVITVGEIVLYESLFASIRNASSGLVNIIPMLSKGAESLNSLSEIMKSSEIEVNLKKGSVSKINGNVEFKNVSYKYPNTQNEVIKDFSLKVSAGECVAVVGSSGSGKSTLMNMIIGFLNPTSGSVLIDGKPLIDCNLSEYRHNISVVSQKSILFDGTIRQNITYGLSSYSEEELQSAIEKANLNEFLDILPNGLDTKIGEHGDKLSGGQRQRITIARALIRNPKILILDEATSALDNISEYNVQKAISSSIKGRTTFIVAHRLSTIRDANKIVVMENGEKIEEGTYDELMAKKGKFYELKRLSDVNLKQVQEELE